MYLSSCVGQDGGNVLQGLGHIESHIGHAVRGHGEDGGQQQALSDVGSTSL
jgi:hypothetical protein